ncbi:hypothetical protein [Brevundimonas sp. Leaf363]|uniref:hypothetical protein n=1 Tax=Brevundimonas sp. Leaf363 TaxID=1736353 RepID=UPI0012E2E783|nr:hypothetical protein [Brevundimonas sp. Leaf363]
MINMLAALALVGQTQAAAPADTWRVWPWLEVAESSAFSGYSRITSVLPGLETAEGRRRVSWVWLYRITSARGGVHVEWIDSRACPEAKTAVDEFSRLPSIFAQPIEESYEVEDTGPPATTDSDAPIHIRWSTAYGQGGSSARLQVGGDTPIGAWTYRLTSLPCWTTDPAQRPPFWPPLREIENF